MAKPFLFRTHSQKLMLDNSKTPNAADDDQKDDLKEGDNKETDCNQSNYILIDHNPKNCILSKRVFNKLDYKQPMIDMLEWRLSNLEWKYDENEPGLDDQFKHHSKFMTACSKIESLVLNPMPMELYKIFYAKSNNKKSNVILFEVVIKLFPNLTDLFLTSTTLKPNIIFKFIAFVKKYNQNEGDFKLKRLFYSKQKPIKERDAPLIKMRLREIGWNFVKSQQMICKIDW